MQVFVFNDILNVAVVVAQSEEDARALLRSAIDPDRIHLANGEVASTAPVDAPVVVFEQYE